MTKPIAVLSGKLRIRLTQSQLESLLKRWQTEGKPGDKLTFQLIENEKN
jgi:hypothetical protein